MNTRRPFDNQGRDCPECLKASRRAIGLPEELSGFETKPGRLFALLTLVVAAIALGMALYGLPVDFG